jgi:hypothetical protein
VFSMTSRYQGLPTATYVSPDGRKVAYVRRRFLPHPEDLTQIGEYRVLPVDRLDRVAGKEFGDAERAWQIADANGAMDTDELTAVPGRTLRITLATVLPMATGMATRPGGAGNG